MTESMQIQWKSLSLALVMFSLVPILVVPGFLDYSQTPKNISIFVVLVLILAGSVLGLLPKFLLKDTQGRISGAGIALLAIAFVVVPSIFVSINLLATTDTLIWQASAILLGAITAKIIPTRYMYLGLILGASIVAVLGLCQVIFDVHYLVPKSDPGQFPSVTFGNRGLAALFVALGVFPTIELLFSGSRRKLALTAVLIIQILFIGITMTRSVWIGVLVAGIVWYLFPATKSDSADHGKKLSSRNLCLLLAVAISVIALIIFANQDLRILLNHRLNIENWLNNPRIELWRNFFEHFTSAPLINQMFGFGPGTLIEGQVNWIKHPSIAGQTFLFLHNDYLDLIWSYGFLGALFIALILTGVLVSAWRAAAANSDPVWVINALLLIVSSTMFYPLSLPYFIFLFTLFIAKRRDILTVEPGFSYSHIQFRHMSVLMLILPIFFVTWKRIEVESGLRFLTDRHGSLSDRLFIKAEVRESLHEIPAPLLYQKMIP